MKMSIAELRTRARTNPAYAEALRKLETPQPVCIPAPPSIYDAPGAAPKPKLQPRQAKQPNRTEQRFIDTCEARRRKGEIKEVRFEGLTLKLADGCRYTPDVMTIDNENRVVFHEVKGKHIWDDSKVKFKVARDQNRWALFEMVQWSDGEWRRIL